MTSNIFSTRPSQRAAALPLPMDAAHKSARILLHALGDDFASGSKLEGYSPAPILEWVHDFLLKHRKEFAVDIDLIGELNQAFILARALDAQDVGTFLSQGQKFLTEAIDGGSPLLIPGGWTAAPFGHSIYYEVLPQEDGTVSFRLYNLGAGIEDAHAAYVQGGKTKFVPFIEWQGIAREKILHKNFLKAIYEMRTCGAIDGKATAYDAEDIYAALKESLSPTNVFIPVPSDEVPLKTPQRSGLCPLRSLMGFLAVKMGSTYKPLKLAMELAALDDFTPHAPSLGLIGNRLLHKSHQKLSRKVVRAAMRDTLQGQDLERGMQTLATAKETLTAFPESPADVPVSFPFKSPSELCSLPKETKALAAKNAQERASLNAFAQEKAYQKILQQQSNLPEMLREIVFAFEEGNHEAVELALLKILPEVSIEKLAASCAGNPAQAQEQIELLGRLANVFFKNCFYVTGAETPDSKQAYLSYKLFTAMSALTPIVEPRFQSRYSFPSRGSCPLPGGLTAAFCNGPIEQDLNIPLSINMIALPPTVYRHTNNLSIYMDKNNEFVGLLYKLYPDIPAEMAKSVPDFDRLGKEEKNALLYTNEHLPHWLSQLIDAHAMWQYLTHGIVAPFTSPQDWKARPFDFSNINPKGEISLQIPEMSNQVYVRYPALKENGRDNKYASSYPSLITPTGSLLFKELQKRSAPTYGGGSEKEVLCQKAPQAKDTLLSDEELREILHIVSKPNVRIEELVTYFKTHREKLKERDFQTIFRMILFRESKNYSLIGHTSSYLHRFLEESYVHFLTAGEMKTAIFFLQVSRQLSGYFPTISFYQGALEEVRTLLKNQDLDPIEKALLSSELLAHLSLKESLEENEIGELLEAAVCYNTTQLPPGWQEVEQEKSLQRALIFHARAIAAACEDKATGPAIMARLQGSLYPSEEMVQWEVTSSEPLSLASVDGRYVFYPCDAKWIGQGLSPLPRSLLDNPLFTSLFPSITHAVAMENGTYHFTAANGNKTICSFEQNTLIVDQEWEGVWMRYLPSSVLIQSGFMSEEPTAKSQSLYLAKQFTHWQDPQHPERIISCDPKRGTPRYILSGDYNAQRVFGPEITIEKVERMADGALLSQPSSSLVHFESKAYIHEWHLNQTVEIELPRFGLTFVNGASKEFPGYRLEAGRRIPSLAPFSNYLILTNAEGKTKIIVPRQFCAEQAESLQESLAPTFKIDRQMNLDEPDAKQMFIYELNGELQPSSREEGLYLAYLFALIQNYEQAAKYLLKFGDRPNRLKMEEIEILRAITDLGIFTGDQSGNGIALRVQTGLFLLKQQNQAPANLFEDYAKLLEHAHHISAITLAKEEEIFLCKSLLAEGFNPVVYMRLHQLDSDAARNTPRVPPSFDLTTKRKEDLTGLLLSPGQYRNIGALTHITRAGDVLEANFNHFYSIACGKDADSREEIRACLPYLKYSQRSRYQTLANFLETVLDHPAQFTSKPYWDEQAWAQKMVKLAKSLRQQEPPFQVAAGYDPTLVMQSKVEQETAPLPMKPLSLPHVPLMTLQPNESADELQARVHLAILDEKQHLQELETTCLALANKTESSMRPLEQWGAFKKVLTQDDLILAFGCRDLAAIAEQNPDLSEQEQNDLMHLVGTYLLHATRLQHLVRGKFQMEEERQYDPSQFPPYLVFEYRADKILYPRQVAILDDFLSGRDVNTIHELCMGSGKSKILVPLLILLRADGKTLSMLLSPAALSEELTADTHSVMDNTLGKRVHTLYFDRNTPLTSLYLEATRDRLLAAIRNKGGLSMTPKSYQCLLLRYIELADRHFMSDSLEIPQAVKILGEIISILKHSGYPLLDEADALTNVLHETSFSLGEPSSPEIADTALIQELYGVLYTDPHIRVLCALENDPSPEEGAPPLTKESYFETVKLPLATIMIGKLQIDALDRKAALKYVMRDGDNQSYFNSLDPDVQDTLALLGEQICTLLPHTLPKVSNKNYGLDEEETTATAIPFSAAKTPTRGSQFMSSEITMNCSFQIFTKDGVSRRLVEDQIKLLQGLAMKQIMEEGCQINKTEAWKRFMLLRGASTSPLFNYNERQLQALIDAINSSYETKGVFAREMILSFMKIYPEKLSANALNMASLSNRSIGFTGTLWAKESMHSKLKSKPDEEIETKSLNILRRPQNGKIYEVKTDSFEELISIPHPFTMLIDSGGYCKDGDNITVATRLARHSGQPVVYYNKEGQQATVGVNRHPEDTKRKVFLDQSHTTGADVVLEEDAIGLITVGENILLRDLLQSMWRLRGIERNQTVHFVLSERVKKTILQRLRLPKEQAISIEEIIQFAILNQLTAKGQHNFIAFTKEVGSILQTVLLDLLLSPDVSPEEKKSAYQILRSQWIQPTPHRAREKFGIPDTERPTKEVVQEQRQKFVQTVETLFTACPWLETKGIEHSNLINAIDALILHAEPTLPPTTSSKQGALTCTLEVEKQLALNIDQELSLETVEAVEKVELGVQEGHMLKQEVRFGDHLLTPESARVPYFALSTYFETSQELAPFARSFEGIDITLNVLQWPNKNRSAQALTLFGEHRTPFHYVQFSADGERLLIHSQVDEFAASHNRGDPYLPQDFKTPCKRYHLTLGWRDPATAQPLTEDQKLKLVKIKFLNGNSEYTKEEQTYLQDWLAQEGMEKMREFYLQHIVRGFPNKRIRYHGSALEKIFQGPMPASAAAPARMPAALTRARPAAADEEKD